MHKILEKGFMLTADGLELLKTKQNSMWPQILELAAKIAGDSGLTLIDSYIIDTAASEIMEKTPKEDTIVEPPAAPVQPSAPAEEKTPTQAGKDEEVPQIDSEPPAVSDKPRVLVFTPQINIAKKPLEGYIQYFRSRYTKISQILRDRGFSHTPLAELKKLPEGQNYTVIGLVRGKRAFSDKTFIDIEDLTGSDSLFVPANSDPKLLDQVNYVIEDVVCAFSLRKGRVNVLKEITFPEIPFKKPVGSGEEVYLVITSDIHFGSKSQDDEMLAKFKMWINGDIGNSEQREIARKTRFLLIAGDLAEGIGVYPEQLQDLKVVSIQDQYRIAAEYLDSLPGSLEIIISPGNHDATQQALPQPFPQPQFAPALYKNPHIRLVPNPCMVSVCGVKILVYHGQAIEDISQRIPHTKITDTIRAAEYLLKIRHLAPIYGGKTQIAPQTEDTLVITEIPQIFVVGHIHVFATDDYRGTLVVSAGTWQKQTEFQVKQGIVPTPGIIAAINMKTLKATAINLDML
jgi:DNA polymerase II small subunit